MEEVEMQTQQKNIETVHPDIDLKGLDSPTTWKLINLNKEPDIRVPKQNKIDDKIRNVIFTIYLDTAVASNYWAPILKTYILDLYHTKTNRFTIYHRSDIRKTFWSAIKILFMKIIERES